MRKIIILITCIACTIVLFGQTPSSADALFKAGSYAEAQTAYQALIKTHPGHSLYLYRYARCAQELGDDTTAIQYFKKSGDRYKLKHLYIAESYLRLWKIEEAIQSYNTYLQKSPDDSVEYVQEKLAEAEKRQRYLKRVEKLQVIDSVEIAIEDMLSVIKLSSEAGKLSLDTNYSLIYTNQRNDRRIWSTTSDSGSVLVTNHRLLDTWSNIDTLPNSINFTEEQCSPYLLTDGVTLYFAAKDKNGIGGWDIFVSRYNTSTETYTTPENIGLPYNSTANEYMLVIDEGHNIGYLATDRFAQPGNVHVYSFAIADTKQYWRNISDEELVSYAKLEQFEMYIAEENEIESNEEQFEIPESIAISNDFYFVINDSIVYKSIQEFRSTYARDKYNEWKATEELRADEQKKLEDLRKTYTIADDKEKVELAKRIIQLERKQNQLQKQCTTLRQEIIRKEILEY